MKSYWIYILKCADNSYYTGVTNNLEVRVSEHENPEYKSYTSTRLPIKLVWYQEYYDINEAIATEKQIKGWRRDKKEALIKGEYDMLPRLSARYTKYKKSS